MKIYTQNGDKGKTNTLKGRVSKSSRIIEVIGGLDELASFLAFAYEKIKEGEIKKSIKRIIRECHLMMGEIAGNKIGGWDERTKAIEREIENISNKLIPLKGFVMETGSEEGAVLHISRAVCRRVEREMVRLNEKEGSKDDMIKYLNRLSDLLFVMARYMNRDKEEYV